MEGPPKKYKPPLPVTPESSQVDKYRDLINKSRISRGSESIFLSKVLTELAAEMRSASDETMAVQAQVAFLKAFAELPIPADVKKIALQRQLQAVLALPNCLSVQSAMELVFPDE